MGLKIIIFRDLSTYVAVAELIILQEDAKSSDQSRVIEEATNFTDTGSANITGEFFGNGARAVQSVADYSDNIRILDGCHDTGPSVVDCCGASSWVRHDLTGISLKSFLLESDFSRGVELIQKGSGS